MKALSLVSRILCFVCVALMLALLAVVIAMVNVAGGFSLTHKMLSSFIKKGDKKEAEEL